MALAAGSWIWGNGLAESIESPVARSHRRIPRRKQLKWRNDLDRSIRAFVTGLGLGYLPLAPGTWASLATLLPVFVIHRLLPLQETVVLSAVVVLLTYPAVVCSTRFSRSEGHPDPSMIVIDEILGQIVCLLWVPVSPFSLGAGFLLFRFFDIVKPFPARSVEKLPGGMGIVFDDLVAGVYAGLCLKLLISFL